MNWLLELSVHNVYVTALLQQSIKHIAARIDARKVERSHVESRGPFLCYRNRRVFLRQLVELDDIEVQFVEAVVFVPHFRLE